MPFHSIESRKEMQRKERRKLRTKPKRSTNHTLKLKHTDKSQRSSFIVTLNAHTAQTHKKRERNSKGTIHRRAHKHYIYESETKSREFVCAARSGTQSFVFVARRICMKLLWLLNTILFIAASVNSDCTTTEYRNAYINSRKKEKTQRFSSFSVGSCIGASDAGKKNSNWTRSKRMNIEHRNKKKTQKKWSKN